MVSNSRLPRLQSPQPRAPSQPPGLRVSKVDVVWRLPPEPLQCVPMEIAIEMRAIIAERRRGKFEIGQIPVISKIENRNLKLDSLRPRTVQFEISIFDF